MSLAGSNFNTLLAIYTGVAVNNLTLVAYNDNCALNIYTSCATFGVVPGTNYSIQVDMKTTGENILTSNAVAIDVKIVSSPSNDLFSAASTTFPATGTTLNATLEPDEPRAGDSASGMSVWYRFTAPRMSSSYATVCHAVFVLVLVAMPGYVLRYP